jgi:hypothetical protein
MDGGYISAVEEVTDDRSAADIIGRWGDQLLVGLDTRIQVWEAMPSFYFRPRAPALTAAEALKVYGHPPEDARVNA